MASGRTKQRGNEIGPTGREVARNVKRARVAAELTQKELSDRLSEMGRPVPVASIGKIESGDRRVEVDDLVAIALALRVSPLSLLLPNSREPLDVVEITGREGRSDEVWDWGLGAAPFDLFGSAEDMEEDVRNYRFRALPWWLNVNSEVDYRRGTVTHSYATKAWDRDRLAEVESMIASGVPGLTVVRRDDPDA